MSARFRSMWGKADTLSQPKIFVFPISTLKLNIPCKYFHISFSLFLVISKSCMVYASETDRRHE